MTENEREHRDLTVTKTDMGDLNETLAWVIAKFDNSYKDATVLGIQIQKTAHDQDEDGVWQISWSASLTGSWHPDERTTS